MNNSTGLEIGVDAGVKEALELLDSTACGILFVVDQTGGFIRTLTDGDLRRLLLDGATLESTLRKLPELDSVIVHEHDSTAKILKTLRDNKVRSAPVLGADRRVLRLANLDDFEEPILLSIPHMGDYEKDFVQEAFDSNWVAPLGPNVDGFEKELCVATGISHAAALSSGTAAIHLALVILGVSQGDVVFCPSLTFVASANPILYQGARPVFIDSAPKSWNMCPKLLEQALNDAAKSGDLPKAIIVVNLYGYSADYVEICQVARSFNVPIVEDAAESIGASFAGKSSGSFGDIGIFSFNGNKIITTSGGGMLVSSNEKYVEKARWLSTQAKDDAPYYLHSQLGYNYRMSNVLAGIGRGQLKVLDERVERRRSIYNTYRDELAKYEMFDWIDAQEDSIPTHWLSVLLLSREASTTAEKLIRELSQDGIEARRVWNPLHRNPLYSDAPYISASDESVSDDLFFRGVCLPSSSNLTELQQARIIDAIAAIAKNS